MASPQYKRLTGTRQRRGFAASSRSSLWLGNDHVLLVITDGFTERYKRFYFRDIQAIVVRKTHRIALIAALMGILTVVFAGIAIMVEDLGFRIFFGIIAVLFFIPFLVNLLLGDTCDCQLQTAVQTEQLPSVSRVRRARKLWDRLRPEILAAQESMSDEEILQRLADSAHVPPQMSALPGSQPGPGSPDAARS